MAKVLVSNQYRLSVAFSEKTLAVYGPVQATVTKYAKRLFVNWALPLLTWDDHDVRCAEDAIDLIRKFGIWQGRLQDKQPRFNAHAPEPTILRDEGLNDQKIRYPVFMKQSAPYVQWTRDADGARWLVQGFSFNDDLPSVGAYFSAMTKLKEQYVIMNRNL